MASKQNMDHCHIDGQLDTCMDENSDQSIHPYVHEPNKGEEKEFSSSSESSTSDEEEIDQDSETANAWRQSTLDWC